MLLAFIVILTGSLLLIWSADKFASMVRPPLLTIAAYGGYLAYITTA